jgi:selenocysteine-specific elongation factor
VQLELDRPIGALHGDRFILRDQSALRTLGGGVVLDAFPPATPAARPAPGGAGALEQPTPAGAAALLALQPPPASTPSSSPRCGTCRRQPPGAAGRRAAPRGGRRRAQLLFAPGQLERYARRHRDTWRHHRKQPDSPGLTQEQLQRRCATSPPARCYGRCCCSSWCGRPLKRSGPTCAGRARGLAAGRREAAVGTLKPWLDEGGIHPPKLSDMLLRDRNLRKDQVMRLLQRLQRMGKVHAVGAEYFIQTHAPAGAGGAQAKLAEADPTSA